VLPLSALLTGRPTVVNLWASWCGPCRSEMPMLAAAQQRERGVRFLFVNQGETAASVQAYLQREGLALDGVWLDAASRSGPAFGSRGLPTTLFFDARGRRVDAHFGVLNAAALQAHLHELRAQ
jgi:thiol-disulfide isomerase/thioredoxin